MTIDELKAKYPHIDWCADDEYLAKVLAFAERTEQTENLLANLEHLGSGTFFGCPCTTRVFKDFAPYSFGWTHVVDGRYAMSGGLIYFGPTDDGVNGPQFSVRQETGSSGWEIHT